MTWCSVFLGDLFETHVRGSSAAPGLAELRHSSPGEQGQSDQPTGRHQRPCHSGQ